MGYFLIFVAYLSGSVPYGLIFTKLFSGIDVRKIGSGNIGTTNVLRTGQKGIAAATLICDALKGFLPVFLASHMGIEEISLLTVAFAAVLGHVFPIWLRYQGGKGVATSLGVYLGFILTFGGLFSFHVDHDYPVCQNLFPILFMYVCSLTHFCCSCSLLAYGHLLLLHSRLNFLDTPIQYPTVKGWKRIRNWRNSRLVPK